VRPAPRRRESHSQPPRARAPLRRPAPPAHAPLPSHRARAGNWKCNGTVESVAALVAELNAGAVPAEVDVVVAPPSVFVDRVAGALRAPFQVAAQNCHSGAGGAFTGEVSADMLVSMAVPWVVLGHSERRSLFGETNETVGQKVAYALSKGLKVIACIGETLAQRESGEMFAVLDAQLEAIAAAVGPEAAWANVVVAYEPVWAIGTGVVASPEQAQEVHAYVRKWLAEHPGVKVAGRTRVLYGGSVSDKNCGTLAALEDVDGFLVGGASLQAPAFLTICNSLSARVAA
jgi:triosephosphate isomerase